MCPADTCIPNELDFPVLYMIKLNQYTHGFDQNNFHCYRHFCTRKIKKLRSKSNIHHFNKNHKSKVVSPGLLECPKYCEILLYQAERCFGFAMEYRGMLGDSGKRVYHHRMVYKIKKALCYARMLQSFIKDHLIIAKNTEICDVDGNNNDTNNTHTEKKIYYSRFSLFEATAYRLFIQGYYFMLIKSYPSALYIYNQSKSIYCYLLKNANHALYKKHYKQIIEDLDQFQKLCCYHTNRSSTSDIDMVGLNSDEFCDAELKSLLQDNQHNDLTQLMHDVSLVSTDITIKLEIFDLPPLFFVASKGKIKSYIINMAKFFCLPSFHDDISHITTINDSTLVLHTCCNDLVGRIENTSETFITTEASTYFKKKLINSKYLDDNKLSKDFDNIYMELQEAISNITQQQGISYSSDQNTDDSINPLFFEYLKYLIIKLKISRTFLKIYRLNLKTISYNDKKVHVSSVFRSKSNKDDCFQLNSTCIFDYSYNTLNSWWLYKKLNYTHIEDLLHSLDLIIMNLNEMSKLTLFNCPYFGKLYKLIEIKHTFYTCLKLLYAALFCERIQKYQICIEIYTILFSRLKLLLQKIDDIKKNFSIENKELLEEDLNIENITRLTQFVNCRKLNLFFENSKEEMNKLLSDKKNEFISIKKTNVKSKLIYTYVVDLLKDFSTHPIVKSTPSLQPMPLKPIYYDLSKRYIEFPTLKISTPSCTQKETLIQNDEVIPVNVTDEPIETMKKDTQPSKGLTGFVKSWLWGSK